MMQQARVMEEHVRKANKVYLKHFVIGVGSWMLLASWKSWVLKWLEKEKAVEIIDKIIHHDGGDALDDIVVVVFIAMHMNFVCVR
jgi:hypothetical protein